ncbi:MAG: aminotransferase [Deltaproteobacteria bacterium]|nr:MAG: aminotransferase [Deltaproteobacteria bacterium]
MKTIESYRELFPAAKNLVYLNHAGVAPMPSPVERAISEVLAECREYGASRYGKLFKGAERVRRRAAEYLDVAAADVAFVKNTSEGISFVAQGFPWREGDRVVVPEGEFPANIYPWLNLKRRGVEVIRVPVKGGRLLAEDFREALSLKRVRVLSVSAVEYGNGFANDLAMLGELCRERGIFFFVDGIQRLGWDTIEPERFGIQALSADSHKWLLGTEGIGLFYISKEARQIIEPIEVGWNSVANPLKFEMEDFNFREDAARYEAGSQAVTLVHGLGAALDLLLEVGIERIRTRALELSSLVAEAAVKRGYNLLSPREMGEATPIVTISVKRAPELVSSELLKEGVFVAPRGGGVRVSTHFFNNESDIEKLFDVLDEVDKQR